jgi:hypothetical protein
MHWLIDESKSFIFQSNPPMSWKIATVGGAILPYEGRKTWQRYHKSIKKGSDYKTEESISEVLDILIECQVSGTLIIGDIGHTSLLEAEQFRHNWVSPHYIYADTQPQHIKDSLKFHLDNLMEKGRGKLSLQDFFKTLNILETITGFIQWLTRDLLKIRAIDLRKIKLIIDDQAKASLITLRSFIHYFLWRRSQEGLFTCPPNSRHLLGKYLRKENDNTFLDTTKLFDEILVEEKANQDDKHSELKIADLLSNFSRRVFNGDYSVKIAKKLEKILISVDSVCFDNNKDIVVNLPSSNQDAINRLLAIKPF